MQHMLLTLTLLVDWMLLVAQRQLQLQFLQVLMLPLLTLSTL